MPRVGFSAASTRVTPLAVGLPPRRRRLGYPAGARDDGHLVGDHERGVEADAELADQPGRFAGLAGSLGGFEERLRAGLRDRAEVVDDLLRASCRCRCRRSSACRASSSGVSLIFQSVLPSSLSALASASNRTLLMASDALRDEFAEEDLAVGVQRVRDEVEELLQFGLELECFGRHGEPRRTEDRGQRSEDRGFYPEGVASLSPGSARASRAPPWGSVGGGAVRVGSPRVAPRAPWAEGCNPFGVKTQHGFP